MLQNFLRKYIGEKMSHKLLNKNEITSVLNTLYEMYPIPECGLTYNSPFELMLSLILAAQCTDERVNKIRPQLTEIYNSPEDIVNAGVKKVYEIIKSCSFPNNKAKHIVGACEILFQNFDSNVPDTMESLTTIPGIGRKSANIILNECFGKTVGIAVDTHVTRISKKLGFTNSEDVKIIEKDLMKKIPKANWSDINHLLVMHGKAICTARKPQCEICKLNLICKEATKNR